MAIVCTHAHTHTLTLYVSDHCISFNFRVTSRTVYFRTTKPHRTAPRTQRAHGQCTRLLCLPTNPPHLPFSPIVLPSSRICKPFCCISVNYLFEPAHPGTMPQNAFESNRVGEPLLAEIFGTHTQISPYSVSAPSTSLPKKLGSIRSEPASVVRAASDPPRSIVRLPCAPVVPIK